ncbi:helix-turn-helix domain-containing protein [Mucilaginibacter phyllosphaerae]|uniref:DNA-binding protein n=1 Tax=Mucilaginibacter phyllosphaerae TaxID=1812349 RepID=A0A4Y8ABP4_9SPHI|nr:helix-turn-helix domain-containing protein [Mucilaginibacter phyllosphaerae]MBB3969293.1 hypothetical protein [Mucilaginibacter phyllosphaerae]TEW65910.1 DNA-binding protein [Mucilaginibacter phyllosphaerae]GGH07483.1 hypothetical protein GCM10007352_12280 [Mucilaginibacter phyllosphaerae]
MESKIEAKFICLEEPAFFHLVENLYKRLKSTEAVEVKWITGEQAMILLGVKSKTTLQSYRDEGKIRYTQPTPKVILYDRESILAFLEINARNTF